VGHNAEVAQSGSCGELKVERQTHDGDQHQAGNEKARLCVPSPCRPWPNPKAQPVTERGKKNEADKEGEQARLHSQFYAPMTAIG
jgi:hypothetical protein